MVMPFIDTKSILVPLAAALSPMVLFKIDALREKALTLLILPNDKPDFRVAISINSTGHFSFDVPV